MADKILIVDDEPDLGGMIEQKFRMKVRSGELQFFFAGNGEEALKKLNEDPSIEIVFTDINMPVMDGLTLLNKMREMHMMQKAVVISAYNDLTNIRTAMNRGAFDFVTKPIDFDDLNVTLTKALADMKAKKEGMEAKNKLQDALIEKTEAQQQMLLLMQEKEKLITEQNILLESQVLERTSELFQQKELVEIRNREMLDSIHYASNVQHAMFPPAVRLQHFFPESFIINIPKDIVSGDFYWFGEINGFALVAIADCTGHGVAGALMSMLGISLLNQLAKETERVNPGEILELLHLRIVDALKQSENSLQQGMDIGLAVFSSDRREIIFAGANRPLWLFRNNSCKIFLPDKQPIGGMQLERKKFTNHKIPVEAGDILYLFTDGYADQFGGKEGKKIMTANFRKMILGHLHLPMPEQHLKLKNHFEQWKTGHDQVDDVLVAGIKIS